MNLDVRKLPTTKLRLRNRGAPRDTCVKNRETMILRPGKTPRPSAPCRVMCLPKKGFEERIRLSDSISNHVQI